MCPSVQKAFQNVCDRYQKAAKKTKKHPAIPSQLRFSIAESKVLGETRRARLTERLSSRLTREGELLITSSRHRERERNIEDARERMAEVLREALQVQKKRRATKPTRGSKKRRLDTKRQRGQVKRDRRSGWD